MVNWDLISQADNLHMMNLLPRPVLRVPASSCEFLPWNLALETQYWLWRSRLRKVDTQTEKRYVSSAPRSYSVTVHMIMDSHDIRYVE